MPETYSETVLVSALRIGDLVLSPPGEPTPSLRASIVRLGTPTNGSRSVYVENRATPYRWPTEAMLAVERSRPTTEERRQTVGSAFRGKAEADRASAAAAVEKMHAATSVVRFVTGSAEDAIRAAERADLWDAIDARAASPEFADYVAAALSMIGYLSDELLHRSRFPRRSTDPWTNLVAQEQQAAQAEILDFLRTRAIGL